MDELGLTLWATSIIITIIVTRYYATRKKKWNEKIKDLEGHRAYVEKIRKSSLSELNRRSFRFIFILLFLISLGFLTSTLEQLFANTQIINIIGAVFLPIKIICFMGATIFAFTEFRVYSDVMNYKKAVERIDEKLEKLKNKIDNV